MRGASLLLLLCGCATGFNRAEMMEAIEADPLLVEAGRATSAQLTRPFKLAVAPPRTQTGWTEEERDAIRGWGDELREAGMINDLVFIPSLMMQQNPDVSASGLRDAARRVNADAVMLFGESTQHDRYANPLSILNLTIVGMWLAPAHHRDAMTVMEGLVVDARTGGVYLTAEGSGEGSRVRPLVYADMDDSVRDARVEALKSIGRDLVAQAGRPQDPPGRRYETPK